MTSRQALLTICVIGVAATASHAQTPYDLVEQANTQLEQGEAQQALQAYEQAASALPQATDELAYNRAVAHYRLGELDAARSLFESSLETQDPQLAARSQFNLGNIAYASALQAREQQPEQTVALLDEAIDHYRRTLRTTPNDLDARANIELAEQLKRQIEDEQEQQQDQQEQQQQNQEQEQQQDQENQQQQGQDGSESQPQPNEPRSSEPQEQEQGQKQDQNEPQESSSDPQDAQQQQGDPESQQDSGAEDPASQEPQSVPEGELKPGTEETSPSDDETSMQDQAQAAQEAKPLSEDEARKLLQAIRDRDHQRRAEQAAREAAGQAPVEKDW